MMAFCPAIKVIFVLKGAFDARSGRTGVAERGTKFPPLAFVPVEPIINPEGMLSPYAMRIALICVAEGEVPFVALV
jgi:hypothetical protein